jgi:Transposase DNA-binding/Transposase DDE domain
MRTSYEKRNLSQSFGDTRLINRYKETCGLFERGLNQTIPQVSLKKSQIKAIYRFFDNKHVNPQKMLSTHRAEIESSLRSDEPVRLLQISDSTELDYTRKKGAPQLGSLNYIHQKGMLLHNSLLFNDLGLPLGLLWQSYQSRKAEDFGKSKERLKLPIEQKETYRWLEHFKQGQFFCQKHPNVELIYLADSEADIMELFQLRQEQRMHLLVRSKHDRLLADKSSSLYKTVSKQAASGQYQITITEPETQKTRVATLEVRFCPVQLTQHQQLKSKPDRSIVQFNAVQVREVNPPEDATNQIDWVLLTTLPVTSFEQAMQIIDYYVLRWLIERFHFLLKSGGAAVEQLQLETAERLQNAITTYSIATFKTLKIRYWAEKSAQSSIYEAGVSAIEYEVLYKYANQKVDAKIIFDKNEPPTIAHYCRVLGQIGGFQPSKKQELPGFIILSRALEKLKNLTDAYLLFCQ